MNTNIYTFFLYSSAADRTNYRYNFSKVKYNSCCLNKKKHCIFDLKYTCIVHHGLSFPVLIKFFVTNTMDISITENKLPKDYLRNTLTCKT